MDKAVLKKFAIESRQDLMQRMENKIKTFYIDEEFSKQQSGDVYILANSKHSLNLSKEEYTKRELLIKRINELGLDQVIEEAAYTWFNRIVAIRYMEVHDYLPLTRDNQSLGIRVLSSKDNTPDPEIMKFTNLVNPELDIDFKKEKYVELKDNNEKFKYILLLVCKKLGRVIPQVFDGVTDYIDILIPDNLLNESGFVNKIITEVPEENYEQVEIIGWLYQYYNQAEKDKLMSSNKAYKKNEIPYVTQIFTPDWIVKYMVENSLLRLWKDSENNIYKSIDADEEFYLDIDANKNQYAVKDITFIDPCCGSGHILVYAFEIFYKMYLQAGYNTNDIVENILKNNLYGMDLDDRACQLSTLAVILKAREYDKNIFNKKVLNTLNIIGIQESKDIKDLVNSNILDENLKNIVFYLLETFKNGKELGSITNVLKYDYDNLENYIDKIDNIFGIELRETLTPLIKQAILLTKRYNIVVTNPPYMGIRLMGKKLISYVEKYYEFSKYDLFSAMLYKWSSAEMCMDYCAMITPMAWAFLDSYSKLRKNLIDNNNFSSFLHLGIGTFGADLGMVSFVIDNNKCTNLSSTFINLTNFKDSETKSLAFKNKELRTKKNIKDFEKFPGCQFGYWISDEVFHLFEKNTLLSKYAEPRQGLATGDNEKFLRKWYEVNYNKIGLDISSLAEAEESNYKWFPFNKGGNFRKWYGNNEYLVNWEKNGIELKNYAAKKYKSWSRTIKNVNYYFCKGITWSTISSKAPSFRAFDKGFIISNSGQGIYLNDNKYYYYLLGLLNTNYSSYILNFLSPTLGFESGYIRKIPVVIDENYLEKINRIIKENIILEKYNWDSSEISWDFQANSCIIHGDKLIKDALEKSLNVDKENFKKIKANEDELNAIYNTILNVNNTINSNIEEELITYSINTKTEFIKDLISYAVGCMFGRYSLDENGLIYAGGNFDENRYKKFKADSDNIIPITDEAYFDDDIVQRFKQFIEVAFGKEKLNENIDFIAETLEKKGTETSEETIRRYFVNDFFNDHVKMYQKRPIYWLLDSGKKNGFKALVYMHRYNENLIPKARLDYLHRIQTTYEKLLSDVNYKLTTDLSMLDKKDAQKRQADLNAKLQEIKEYDEKIAHIANQRISIDLDNGVKANYEKFKDILAKIK